MKSGSPGSWDREMHRATSYVSLPGQFRTGRARWNSTAPLKSRGYYISVAETTKPYGRSTHTSAYLTHIVIGVLVVWKNGQYQGSQARWRCGARVIHFELIDEPTSTVCPACKIERLGPRRRNEN